MKHLIFAVCAATLVFSCSEESNPTSGGNGGTPPAGAVKLMTGSMRNSGSTMTTIFTSTECDSTALITSRDTTVETFEVTATKLTLNDSYEIKTLTRIGIGTGLQGTWSMDDETFGQIYLVIGTSTIEKWVMPSSIISIMKDEIAGILQGSTITVDTSNSSAIKLTGTKTGEIVTISVNSSAQLLWTSNKSRNSPHTYSFINPTDCTVSEMPDWFMTFFIGNMTLEGLPKIGLPWLKKVRLVKN